MKPLRASIIVAATTFITSMIYLLISTFLVSEMSVSAAELARLELYKGSVFMLVISLVVFGLTYYFTRQVQTSQQQIYEAREHLLEIQNRVLSGTLTASVSHDLKNLLGVIQPNLEFATDESLPETERQSALEDALSAARGLRSLNDRLTRIAEHGHRDEPEEHDLSKLAQDAFRMVEPHSKLRERDVEIISRDVVPIKVFPDLAVHAIINLIINSADATDKGGKIRIYIRRRTGSIELSVHDDGAGMSVENRDELLEPFRTTKAEGTGLGLFIVDHFARMHGGHVDLGDSEMGGALVTVHLPRDSDISLSDSDPIFVESTDDTRSDSVEADSSAQLAEGPASDQHAPATAKR